MNYKVRNLALLSLFLIYDAYVFKCVEIIGFSVIQILREIKVGESRRQKSVILTHLEGLNFDFHDFLYFLEAEICQN